MPLKMMRRNVLVNTGPTTNLVGAKLVELPDYYKRKNSRGHVVAVGPKCVRVNAATDIGREVVIGIETDPERWISPTHGKAYGLADGCWHAIVSEDKLIYEIAK
jgi:co-chaperonin GroES (HSP10)